MKAKHLERDSQFDDALAANEYAEVYLSRNQWAEAIAACHQAIQIQPDFAPAYKTLADILQIQGKVDAAIRAYSHAVALNPSFAEAYANLGNLLYQIGCGDEAMVYQQKALELQPELYNLDIHIDFGVALANQGKLPEAIAFYQHFLKWKDDYAPAYLNLGIFLKKAGDLETAIACFRSSIEVKPDFPEGYFNLGYALQQQGNFSEAIACFRKAIALQPNMAMAYFNLGYVLQEQGKVEEAIACFQKTIAIQPNFAEAYNNLGLLIKEEDDAAAIAYFTQAIQIQPDFAQAYRNLGIVFQKQGQLDKASACFYKAIAIQPDLAIACGNLGYVLHQQNKPEEAIPFLRKAIELQPDLSMAYGNLGNILHQKGKLEEAIACFQKAIQFDSNFYKLFFVGQRHLEEMNPNSFVELPVRLPQKVCLLTKDLATTSEFDSNNPQLTYLEIDSRTVVHLSAGKTPLFPDTNPPDCLTETRGYSPETYVAIVPDGRAWGDLYTTVVLTSDHHILADISTGNVPFLSALPKLPPVQKLDGNVAFLSAIGGDTYYHWMVDILPRFELLRRSGFDLEAIDRIVLNHYIHPFQKETLKRLGIPEHKILTSFEYPHIQATRLIVPSVPSSTEKWFGPFIEGPSQWVCNFLRDRFLPLDGSQCAKKAERIYISRRNAKMRRFVNEDEVSRLLESLGFKTLILESLSVSEQISILAAAQVVVAPHGAGLTNTIFCQPGTKLIEVFAPRYVRNCYWIMSNQVGLDYYYLIGEDLENYYSQYRDRRPKPVYCPPRTENIYVNLDSLLRVLKLAGVA